jgi:aryl-alcohol dehydrogenase-like predicted oxidoreductase
VTNIGQVRHASLNYPRACRRLRTDHIDLYQIQRLDPATDIEETLSALSDLIHKRGRLVIPTTLAATARS